MAKSGSCTYCLQQTNQLEDEHVFPSSWYPESTPSNVQRWTVPGCRECNQQFSKVEETLRNKLALCVDPSADATMGIPEKALRSLKPAHARNTRDLLLRQGARDRLRREIVFHAKLPQEGVLPNFGAHGSQTQGLTVTVERTDLETLGRKLVRGMTYALDHRLIQNPDSAIEVCPLEDAAASELWDMARRCGQVWHAGPGFSVGRPAANASAFIYVFRIWGLLNISACLAESDHWNLD